MKNKKLSTQAFWLRTSVLAVASALALPMFAAEAEDEEKAEDEEVRVVIVGSRAAPRSIGDSAVPVDIISGEEFESQGLTDMQSMLSTSVPSFNVNQQPISDAATLVRPANLRGLPPDSTLILVNGKRRHRAAVISFLGGGISDGSQGPDISAIPSVALQQIEVLRDGAAAQYGSDAIAGVINFVLRDDADGGYVELTKGRFSEGDGDSTQLSGYFGLPLTDRGHLTISYEYKQSDPTDRSIQRSDAAALATAQIDAYGSTTIADPAQIWGAPEIKSDYKIFFNAGVDLSSSVELYSFGNFGKREVEGGFFYRNPTTRSGVFSNDGGATLLVGDPNNPDNSACPTVTITGGIPDQAALDSLDAAGCFSFYERFPGGFTPRFGGEVQDKSISFGVKGETDTGMGWDVSYVQGSSFADFFIKNTLNAAYGENSPTAFKPGAYKQIEEGLNFDLTFPLDSLSIATGVEVRNETFEITAGNDTSYSFNNNLAAQGFGIGSNGFPGFQPDFAGSWDRGNYAAYVDIELDKWDDFLLTGAVRFEDYDDFGSTTNWKISARVQSTDNIALRGAVSTGFRAPTVGQANVRNVTTAFGANGLEDQATLPPDNPISVQKGGKALTPEESDNFSVGTVWEYDNVFVTVDYYHIKVRDRISQNSPQELTADDIAALLAQGVTDASSYSSVRFFTNDFDTTTEGIDMVINYSTEWFGGDTDLSLIYNWTDTTVDRYNPDIISETRVLQLEDNLPDIRSTVSMNQRNGDLRTTVRYNHYHGYYEAHLDDGTLPIWAGSEYTIDLEFGYDVTDGLNVVFGLQNMLDNYPDKNPHAEIVGAQYPVTSPMGFNGRYMYMRFGYNF